MPLVLASRLSPLALKQAEEVEARLKPLPVTIEGFSTKGDEVLDRSLADIGGKGLFVKYIEEMLLKGRADAAVHSAKDMETVVADGTIIAGFLSRGDRRDALVGAYADLASLPHGAAVGTSSARRANVIRAYRSDLRITLTRGNITSRLKKLATGEIDALVLAMAGLDRLGVSRDVYPINEEEMLPAAGQGAIAVQVPLAEVNGAGHARKAAVRVAIEAINDKKTFIEVMAERAVVAELDGSCRTPIGASAHLDGDQMVLSAMLGDEARGKTRRAECRCAVQEAIEAAKALARKLLKDA